MPYDQEGGLCESLSRGTVQRPVINGSLSVFDFMPDDMVDYVCRHREVGGQT